MNCICDTLQSLHLKCRSQALQACHLTIDFVRCTFSEATIIIKFYFQLTSDGGEPQLVLITLFGSFQPILTGRLGAQPSSASKSNENIQQYLVESALYKHHTRLTCGSGVLLSLTALVGKALIYALPSSVGQGCSFPRPLWWGKHLSTHFPLVWVTGATFLARFCGDSTYLRTSSSVGQGCHFPQSPWRGKHLFTHFHCPVCMPRGAISQQFFLQW